LTDGYDSTTKEIILKYKEGNQEKEMKFVKNQSGVSGSQINESKFKVEFNLDLNQKKRRIVNILEAIKNGFYAQSSGEANTIIPLFLIAGAVKVPSPVFHPYIDVRKENGQWKVIGVGDALKNSWIEKDGNKKSIVYIQDCERLKVDSKERENILNKWDDFLREIGISTH
jgi:CRISPR-associated protein Cst2